MTTPTIEVIALSIGRPRDIEANGKPDKTAIYKDQVDGRLHLGKINIAGDEQYHLKFHGGPDRAVCAYSYEHYPLWEQEFGIELPLAAFGENLLVKGMLEQDVCIGDIYRWGDALIQVTQPRIPCPLIDHRNDVPDFYKRFMETGFTGYFFRVLEEGYIAKDAPLTLVERNPHAVTLLFANQIWFHDKENIDGIKRILAVPELAAKWRELLENRLANLQV